MRGAAIYPESELRALLPFEHFNYVTSNAKLILQTHAEINTLSEMFVAYTVLNNYSHFQRIFYCLQI